MPLLSPVELNLLQANSMINNIGYPNITNDIGKLDEQYKEVLQRSMISNHLLDSDLDFPTIKHPNAVCIILILLSD